MTFPWHSHDISPFTVPQGEWLASRSKPRRHIPAGTWNRRDSPAPPKWPPPLGKKLDSYHEIEIWIVSSKFWALASHFMLNCLCFLPDPSANWLKLGTPNFHKWARSSSANRHCPVQAPPHSGLVSFSRHGNKQNLSKIIRFEHRLFQQCFTGRTRVESQSASIWIGSIPLRSVAQGIHRRRDPCLNH